MNLGRLRARLDETLFQDSPPRDPALGRGPELAIVAALFVVAVMLQMLRVGWSISLHSLWAEDAPIFLQEGIKGSFGDSLFDTYATYLVLVPRAIGEAAALVPLQDAPAAISILSCAVVALSGVVVWYATAGLISSPYLRGALALLTVLSPVGGLESTSAAAYVAWYMLFASFWVLLWRPATRAGAVAAGAFVLLTGLSSPGLWFFVPLAILRTLCARDGRDAAILAGFWTGAVVQLGVLLLNSEAAVEPAWSSDVWGAYLQRVVDGAALGTTLGGEAWTHLGWPFMFALAGLGLGLLGWAIARSNLTLRLFALIAIPTSVAMFVVSAYQRAVGSQLAWPADFYHEAAGRYAIVPALLLVSVAAVAIDRRSRRREDESRPTWLAIAVLAAALLVAATSFDVEDAAVRGTPSWEASLEQSASVCASEEGAETGVQTSPPGWGLSVPCEDLASFAPSR